MRLRVLMMTVVASLLAAACGGGETAPTATSLPTAAPTAQRATAQATSASTAAPTAAPTPRPTAAPPTATAAPVPTGQFRFALSTFRVQDMLPGRATRFNLDPMYDYIVGSNAAGELEGNSGLATSWQMAPDGKMWTFRLRDTVRFHNGDRASSADVKFTFDWVTREASAVATAAQLRSAIQAIETPDASTAVVRIATRNIFFALDFMSPLGDGAMGFLLPKNYLEAKGEVEGNKAPIGSGLYRFKENRIGDRISYQSGEPHWYYGIARYQTLEYVVIPEESTRLALQQTGGAEMVEVSRAGAAASRKAGMTVKTIEDAFSLHVRAHDQWKANNPLGNVKVRQALSMAIDRDAVVATFLLGEGTPTVSYQPPSTDLAYEKLPIPPRDLGKARQLLQEAGYAGFELNVVVHETAGVPEGQEIMEALAVWWEQIGVKVKRSNLAYATVLKNWAEGTFPAPTVTGLVTLSNRVSTPRMGSSVMANQIYRVSQDAELAELGNRILTAASIEEYIKLGREYGRKYTERAIMPTIATVGQSFAVVPRIDAKAWDLGPGQQSIRILDLTGRPKA